MKHKYKHNIKRDMFIGQVEYVFSMSRPRQVYEDMAPCVNISYRGYVYSGNLYIPEKFRDDV